MTGSGTNDGGKKLVSVSGRALGPAALCVLAGQLGQAALTVNGARDDE